MLEREASESGAVVIRLARPPVNALDAGLIEAVEAALAGALAEGATAVVLTGSGVSFSAGIDTKMAAAASPQERLAGAGAINAMVSTIYSAPIPVVAAVNGHALGGGLVMALACDVRVAAEGSYQIALNEVAAGVPFPAAPLRVVQAQLDPSVVNDLCLTGRRIGPAEAKALHVVDEVVEPGRLGGRALELALELASFPAYARVKDQLRGEVAAELKGIVAGGEPMLESWRRHHDPEHAAS